MILFKTKEFKSRDDVAVFLEHLAKKLKEGKLTLKTGQEEVQLNIPGKVVLEVQVDDKDKRSKGIQHSLEVEIKWYDRDLESGTLELE